MEDERSFRKPLEVFLSNIGRNGDRVKFEIMEEFIAEMEKMIVKSFSKRVHRPVEKGENAYLKLLRFICLRWTTRNDDLPIVCIIKY
jgi:hypothetical protein